MEESNNNSAFNWFSANKLVCNRDKTQTILLGLSAVDDYQSVMLLRFHIDSKLDWKSHIDNTCGKISMLSYLVWKLREIVGNEYL